MDDGINKSKRTLKNVSHLFLSALEAKKESPVEVSPVIAPDQTVAITHESHCTLMSLKPLGFETFSMLVHVAFGHLFANTTFKVCVLSNNIHADAWQRLEKLFNLPPFVDIDLSSGVRTFPLTKDFDLMIAPNRCLEEFFVAPSAMLDVRTMLTQQERPLLLLVDMEDMPEHLSTRLASLIDRLVILSAVRTEEFIEAYKTVKIFCAKYPQMSCEMILNGKRDDALQQFVAHEFNHITKQFLDQEITFNGFCPFTTMLRGNNVRWHAQNGNNLTFEAVDTREYALTKTEDYTTDFLCFYHHVISRIK